MIKDALVFLFLFCFTQAFTQESYFPFSANKLICLSDGDMSLKALYDNDLSSYENEKDYLSILYLAGGMDSLAISKIPVSNSALPLGNQIVVSRDGNSAFVIESRGSDKDLMRVSDVRKDLPDGALLSIIDVTNIALPELKDQIEIGSNPSAIALHPSENLLLVATQDEKQFKFVSFEKGRITSISDQNIGSVMDIEGILCQDIVWNNSGDMFAASFSSPNYVAIFEFDYNTKLANLIGEPFFVGEHPGKLKFTPNDKILLANDRGSIDERGKLTTILIERQNGDHIIASEALLGKNVSDFEISNSGKYIVVTAMEGSQLHEGEVQYTPNGSLTLFTLNSDNGRVLEVFSSQSQGPMPGNVFFDKSGITFGYTIYEKDYGGGLKRGVMDFRMIDEGNKQLVPTNFSLTSAPGLHTVKAVY